MLGILKRMEENERLSALRKRLKPAELRGINHCVRCSFCCKQRVCIPTPKEIPKIAKFLKIDVKTLTQKYMAVDRRNGSPFFLRWLASNIKDCARELIPWDRTYDEGNCVFLGDKNLCQIYSVLPKDAQSQRCWKKDAPKFNPLKEWKEKSIERFGFSVDELEDEENE